MKSPPSIIICVADEEIRALPGRIGAKPGSIYREVGHGQEADSADKVRELEEGSGRPPVWMSNGRLGGRSRLPVTSHPHARHKVNNVRRRVT